jgi:sirohydrochlorin cobaltochelatase
MSLDIPPGILLFAHGARDPAWAAPFDAVAERIRRDAPGTRVELAFLEFMCPDIAEAGRRLADAGCTAVSVVPLFLGAGGHVRKDLPALLQELAARHPAVQWELRSAIGELPSVIEAMALAALEQSRGPHIPR